MRRQVEVREAESVGGPMDVYDIRVASDIGHVGEVMVHARVRRQSGDGMSLELRVAIPNGPFIPPEVSYEDNVLTVRVTGHLEYASFADALLHAAREVYALSVIKAGS